MPTPQEARDAVMRAGCERSETTRYIRFFCEQGPAFWYFTREGRPEHPGYFVAPAYALAPGPYVIPPPYMIRERADGTFGRASTPNQDAFRAWVGEIRGIAEADAMPPKLKRDSGKLYPLEPS